MSITEMLHRTFLEGYISGNIQVSDVLSCLLVTGVLGIFIYIVYRYINKRSFYYQKFNMSLPVLAIIIAAVILTIQSNIVVSLGMVGALSIVRFRTAIKDPMDLVFLFWSISVGIICGAGFAAIAVVSSVVVAIIVILFARIPSAKNTMVLLVNSSSYESEDEIIGIVKEYCRVYKVKARNLTKDHMDMAIEVSVSEQGALVKKLMSLETVTSASIVSHNGEITV